MIAIQLFHMKQIIAIVTILIITSTAQASGSYNFSTNVGFTSSHRYWSTSGTGGFLTSDLDSNPFGGTISNYAGYVPPQPTTSQHLITFVCDTTPCATGGNFDNVIEYYTAYIGSNAGTSFQPDTYDWTILYPNYNTTRIVSFTPENGTTTPTNNVEFNLHAFISPSDVTSLTKIHVQLTNINQNTFVGGVLGFGTDLFYGNATTTGDWYFSTTTNLASGNYRVEVRLESYLGGFLPTGGFPGNVKITESHQFVVVAPTFIGNISQNLFDQTSLFFSSSTATTTESLNSTCNFLNPDFSVASCLAYLLIPDANYTKQTVLNFRNTIATHFPLGYINDLFTILATTSTTTIPGLNATLPATLPGGGATINLNFNHVFDTALNTKASDYGYGTSTETLYETTSYYWKLVVYLATGLWVLSRVLGQNLVPGIGIFGDGSNNAGAGKNKGRKTLTWKEKRRINRSIKKGPGSVIH